MFIEVLLLRKDVLANGATVRYLDIGSRVDSLPRQDSDIGKLTITGKAKNLLSTGLLCSRGILLLEGKVFPITLPYTSPVPSSTDCLIVFRSRLRNTLGPQFHTIFGR